MTKIYFAQTNEEVETLVAAKEAEILARSGDVLHAASQQFKADAGKAKPDLLEYGCANALRLVQATTEYGSQKYEEHSWRKVPDALNRYVRAGGRHRQDRILDSQDYDEVRHGILYSRDPESGLPHIAHEIINLMFMLELALAEEAEVSGDTITVREITANLVGNMKKPPLDHKKA